MARIKKFAPEQKLSSFQTFLVDSNPNSDYFRITEFKDTFTGGKNGFLIEGSEYLKESTEIKIEILDVAGNPVYYEPGNGIPEYYEGISKLIAVYIYNDTPIGLGKITILGELKEYEDNGVKREIPSEWKGAYNVKWEKTFQINKNLANEDKVRFYRRPQVAIDEVVKPIFSGNPPLVTQVGTLDGIPLVPTENTNLSNFSLPTSYRLRVNSGNKWTGSIAGQTITFDNISYSPTINDVVNETELIVSPPYTENNLVKSFTNQNYSITFPYIEGVNDLATALTGSFAKINITDMKTFVGDAARVKVFRRSQSNLTDYEFVQEIQLESNELLRDITTFDKKEENYGIFTQDVLSDYWVTSSNDIVVALNQDFLYNSAKLNSSPNNYFYTSQSFSIQNGVEYTLDLNVRKTANTSGDYLRVFLSGSTGGSSISTPITTINSSNTLLQKTNFTQNIVANSIETASLYFEVSGSDWYINNVSLKASQETSFSPDEITFIQQVPKTLVTETFDYRFEFYDINNNFIPVRVETTKTFVGGNTNLFNKSISITPDNLYFSFDSASNPANAIPPFVINFDVETTLVTGSITYTSGAYDFFGNLIPEVSYSAGTYPGYLTNWDVDGGRQPFLRVQDFTGSRDDITVQFIRYTGDVEGVSDTFVITRVEDGKGGVSFEIVPYRGLQIKNKESKTLEVQAVRVDGINRIDLRSGLTRGFSDAKLHLLSSSLDGVTEVTTYVSLSQAITNPNFIEGVSVGLTGSGEIDYNAIFTRDAIDNELTLFLMDGPTSESILTSIILTDLKDGLNNGIVNATTEQFNIKYEPRKLSPFNPQQSIVTASFQRRGTTLNPLSASLIIYPSASIEPKTELPHFYMFYETGAFDNTITLAVTDYLGNPLGSGIPGGSVPYYEAVETKQLNLEFTYIEPITSASVTANKSFFITPDGLPGQNAIIIDIEPQPVALGSNHKGEVYNYSLANTNIQVTQGDLFLINTASGDPGTFTTRSITPTNIQFATLDGDSSTTMSLGGFISMSALSASIRYEFDIYPYFTASLITASRVQSFTKVVEGGGAVEVTLDPIAVAFNADESGFISNYSAASTEVFIKQNDEFLIYDPTDAGTPGTFLTASISASGIAFSQISSSQRDTSLGGDEILHFKGFGGIERNQPSASITYNFKVYPYSLDGGTAGVQRIVSKTQTFSKVNDGSKARKVSLTTNSDTIVYDGDSVKVAPVGSVILTATAFNTTGSAYFEFLDSEGSVIGGGSSTSTTVNVDNYLPGPGSSSFFTVNLRDGNPTGLIADVDSVTVSGVQGGSTSYSVALSNGASSVTVERDGTIYFDNSATLIRGYKGGTELQYVERYDAEAVDPVTFLPIGTFGQFSASVFAISSFLTQGTLRDGKEIVSSSGELYGSASGISNWNLPQDNTQGFITYKVDFENGRGTQFIDQTFSTVFEGATGPGIVVRGEWTGSIEYIYTADRRDVVVVRSGSEGDTHYFATTDTLVRSGSQPFTTPPSYSVSPATEQGDLVEGNWEYLGQQELFVAAKIAIFEESFVENTINVGQPPSNDPNANIVIAGSGSQPFIAVGQSGIQGFRQEGIFMGIDNNGGVDGSTKQPVLSLKSETVGSTYKSLEWDGESLTIRGAIRQTSEGEVESRALQPWSTLADGFLFLVGDIVSHNGITWECIVEHNKGTSPTYPAEPGVGGSYATYWQESNLSAKTIRLSADSQIFRIAKDGSVTPTTITLTANRQNIAASTVFTTSPSPITIGEPAADTATLSYTNFSQGGANKNVTVIATAGAFSDEITIVELVEGSDGITVVNTNQSHTVPANADGSVTSFVGSGTKIEVYEGANKLDYDGTFPLSSGSFIVGNVVVTPTGDFTIDSSPTLGSDYIEYGDGTAMDAGTDVVGIRYGITGSRSNGTEFRIDTFQTITKAKTGASGSNGESGSNGAGVVYRGEWNSSDEYIATTQRKDVVKYSTNSTNPYWIAKTTHTNQTPPSSGATGNTYWEGFGATFTSVATDILFAQDVYANRTVNIGSNNGSPVIALNADSSSGYLNPRIQIGQDVNATGSFGSDGIYFGYSGGNPVLSMVSGSTFFIYESGSIELSDASFVGTGSIIEGASIRVGRNLDVSSTASNAYNFTVSTEGVVSASQAFIQGTIAASAGNIGNWVIDPIIDGNGGVLRDIDSELVFDPNIPEIQIYSGSVQRVFIGASDLTSTAAVSTSFDWTTPEPAITSTTITSNALNTSTVTTNVYTALSDNSVSITPGTYGFTGIDWPTGTIVEPLGITTPGNSAYPNYQPSFEGQIHGGFGVYFQRPRTITAALYLEVVDTNNGNAVIGTSGLISNIADGDFPTTTIYIATNDGGGVGFESVIGSTEITLSDGTTKLAKDCTIDDIILAWSDVENKWISANISKIYKRDVTEIYKVVAGGYEVEVSDTHGFWLFGTEGNSGKIRVTNIIEGVTKIWIKDGDTKKEAIVDKVEKIEKQEEVITFTIPTYVNYISNNIISHNVIGSLAWEPISTSFSYTAGSSRTLNSGTNITRNISITTATTAAKLRYRLFASTTSGNTIDVASNGSTTNTYYQQTADIAQTNTGGKEVYFASSRMNTDGIQIEKSNNFVELKPSGIQLVTSENIFIRARRKDSLVNTFAADAELFRVEGGTSYFTAASTPFNTAIAVDGHIRPEASGWDLGAGYPSLLKFKNLNGFDIEDLAVSKSTSGYARLFDNIIIQWVRTTSTEADGKHSGTWPTAFNTIYGAVISKGNASSTDVEDNNTANISYTTTNWYVNFNENGTRTTFIIAIGEKA